MHKYKNGRQAQHGDYVIGPIDGEIIAGKIGELTGQAVILYPVQGRTIFAPIDPAKFMHAQEAMEACECFLRGEVVRAATLQAPVEKSERPPAPATVTEPAAPVISMPMPGTVTAAPKEVSGGGALSITE